MIAVPRAIALAGLSPVFVDCGDDLLMDIGLLSGHLSECSEKDASPAAVVAVHIYGRVCDVDQITNAASWERFRVIEDLAEAHGVRPHLQTDAACWSFFRNKVIAGQEGGAVYFRDPARAAIARQLRCLGFTDKHDFLHVPRGHNYRLSNIHAELILDSLANVDANVARRREVERWYDELCPTDWRMPARISPWVYDLRIPGLTQERQDHAVRLLIEHGIQARHAFRPMSWQEEFANCRLVRGAEHVAARLGVEVLYLPLAGVTQEDAKLAFEILRGL